MKLKLRPIFERPSPEDSVKRQANMNLLIGLVGVILVAIGIFWRLRVMKARAKAGDSLGMPRRGSVAQPRQTTGSSASQKAPKAAAAKRAEAEAPKETAPTTEAEEARRSDRVLLKIPLDVSGIDLKGNSFTERTQTRVINRNGASFVLHHSLQPDAPMTVKNVQTGQSAKFRARQVNQDLPGGLREWGVECIDPAAPHFWGISFPEPVAEEKAVGAVLECAVCRYREMTGLTLSEYRSTVGKASFPRLCLWCGKETDWIFAVIEDIEEPVFPGSESEAPAVSPLTGAEKRGTERRIVKMPILIRHNDGREELTITENLSKSGVSCAANLELEVGDRVSLTLESNEGSGRAESRAQIRWRRGLGEKRGFLYGMMFARKESPAS